MLVIYVRNVILKTLTFLPFLPILPAVPNFCIIKKCNLSLLTFLTNITHPPLFKLISNCVIQNYFLTYLTNINSSPNFLLDKKNEETICNLSILTFLTNITYPPLFKFISNCENQILHYYLSYQHYQLSLFFPEKMMIYILKISKL